MRSSGVAAFGSMVFATSVSSVVTPIYPWTRCGVGANKAMKGSGIVPLVRKAIEMPRVRSNCITWYVTRWTSCSGWNGSQEGEK